MTIGALRLGLPRFALTRRARAVEDADPVAFNPGVLLLPALALFLLTFVGPQLFVAVRSLRPFLGMGLVGESWTLKHYALIFGDTYYLWVLLRTMWMGLLVVAVTLVIGYPLAYSLARSRSRWRGVLITLVIAPLFTSIVIRALGWMILLGSNGPVNQVLLGLGVISEPIQLLYNMTGTVIGIAHALLPFMVLILLGVIQKIDRSLEEAAEDLGATRPQVFWRVILPLSVPGILAGSLLVFSMAVSVFTTPAMLGGRKVAVVAIAIEQQIRATLNYPLGSALSVILLVFTLVVTILALRKTTAKGSGGQ